MISSIAHAVAGQAARFPGRIAAQSGAETIGYARLWERAIGLAGRLRAAGIRPDDVVGVLLERSLDLPVAMLGVLAAGGACVPLDPDLPAQRLAYMLDDAGVSTLVAGDEAEHVPDAYSGSIISLHGQESAVAHPVPPNPDNLAYVIYTSGSTGRPKAAMNTHRGIVNRINRMQDAYRLTAEDRVLQKTPISFDVAFWELFWPLTSGARVVLARPGGHRDPAYMAELIHDEEVTTLHFVPSMLRAFLETPAAARCTSVRRLICGGEALPADLAERLSRTLPGARLYNFYGPAETAVDVTAWPYRPGADPIPIGAPIPGVRAYVVDDTLTPVGQGGDGELLIGGVAVGRGYRGRPGLTAERFVPDHLSGEHGARLYRTGDRARWLPDGTLEFLGRLDDQVKIRGVRVEPGEAEAVLAEHDGVRAAAVVADGARLIGYVIPDRRTVTDPAALIAGLRRHAQAALPEVMVPSAFVLLEEFPLNPNGKLDRAALPPPPHRPELTAPWTPPRGPVAERLAAIWSGLLGVDEPGADHDFFELGGHSLLATRLVARIRAEFGVELPLDTVFGDRTIARLAEAIPAAPPAGELMPEIRRAPRDRPLPLSYAQERLWFLLQLHPGIRSYQHQARIELTGALDPAALEAALTEIIRRHEVYRTTFAENNGVPVQVVHPPFPVTLPVNDLRQEADPEAAAAERIRAEVSAEIPLDRLPLVRWRLLRLSGDRYTLLHVEHHLVHDGWGFNAFLNELFALYTAEVTGTPPALPEPEVQFADYAVWERSWMDGPAAERRLAYWREQLRGVPQFLDLPTDRPRPPIRRFAGDAPRFTLPGDLADGLRELARRERCTLFMTMMAAFQLLLGDWSGQDHFCVGSGVANRHTPETERLFGMIVNTVAVRADLRGEPTFRELLGRVRATMSGVQANGDVPFDRVVAALRPERVLGRHPLCQVSLAFHDSPLWAVRMPGLDVEIVPGITNGSAKFDINVVVIPHAEQAVGQAGAATGQSIDFFWEYDSDLFDAATMTEVVRRYRRLLEAAVADPSASVYDLAERALGVPEPAGAGAS